MDYLLQLPEQLSPQLKSLRRAAGMSQAKLAQHLGVSQSRVAAIESDPSAISVRQLMEVLRILNAVVLLRMREPTSCEERSGDPVKPLIKKQGKPQGIW
ncbi:helix-turn-helix domain-containing protein [Delftia tsuruhatensis]|uniref:helix-turn-helix domain-containing protein n=1 Tax=Delftia tsuruhatensis TaxID=180282 RepID=UPI0012A785D6|nr:helix-turn-helix transcriptional regulator [Delftia tsuruhatensis]QFS66551.1 helix-turn-helix domain-containing protein [Delftia tsuruhatensis]